MAMERTNTDRPYRYDPHYRPVFPLTETLPLEESWGYFACPDTLTVLYVQVGETWVKRNLRLRRIYDKKREAIGWAYPHWLFARKGPAESAAERLSEVIAMREGYKMVYLLSQEMPYSDVASKKPISKHCNIVPT